MPDMDGLEVLRHVKQEDPATEVILMTAYATVTQAVEAVKSGAYHYLTKPFEPDELQLVLQKALERRQLKEETRILKEQVQREYGFPNIVGESEAMRRAYNLARKAAESDTTVMLTGESGTGKEVFARAIHVASARSSNRFVAVNCGAMPSELIESELFGHVKGAFSGAMKDKKGLFMEADGGTILLDEITELDPELQVKINRVIQEREIRRVGDTRDVSVDVRIIAASNRDLLEAVEEGYFREDLYYRLNVFPIPLPPLREREGDIPLLVGHFLSRLADGEEPYSVDAGAMETLINYHWPGNVRQLQNAVERAVVLAEDRQITADLFNFIRGDANDMRTEVGELANLEYREAMDRASERFQRRYLTELLKRTGGNVTRAAEKAGIERESFHRLMRKVDVDADEIRQQAD
jgi:two-component system response regulator HydG